MSIWPMPQSNSSSSRMRTFTASLWNQRVCYPVLSRPHPPSLGPVQEQSSQSFLRWKNGYSCESIGTTVLPRFKPCLFHKPPVWLPANMPYFSHAQDGDDDYGYLGGLGVCGGGEGGGTDVQELNKTVHQYSQCSKRIHSLWKTGWQVFKKLKIELLYDLGFHFWVFTQKKWKQRFQQICVHPGA